jgi:hypothetical protein
MLDVDAVPGVSRLKLGRLVLSLVGMDRHEHAITELAQVFGMRKAMGDALQALIARDVHELERALIALGTSSDPQLAGEEEGVIRGVLSALRGDVYAVTDLVRALGLNKDAVEVGLLA